MAAAKKYAHLPDIDISSAPEIYETPSLTTDDTATETVHTHSPFDSDESPERRHADRLRSNYDEHDPRPEVEERDLDRSRLDTDSARRRFEPSLVDGRRTDFGDRVDGEGQGYRTRNRRRKGRRRNRPVYGESSGEEDESEEEGLGKRIARLKREAEEVRLELARREGEGEKAREGAEGDDVEDLGRLMQGLNGDSTGGSSAAEKALLNGLDTSTQLKEPPLKALSDPDANMPSSTAAIAAFSDRLTALESALGLSNVDPTSQPKSILPTLDSLSRQVTTLSSTITPSRPPNSTTSASLPQLDALQSRISTLTSEADRLTTSRQRALQSLTELHEARIRYTTSRKTAHSRPTSSHQPPDQLQSITVQENGLHSQLFLEEQSDKINALYQLLPSIQNLQPLLPTVLERLRSLSVIHAGAAEAREELDDVLRRQGEMKNDVDKWREAVEGVEKKMVEMKGEMRECVKEVGGMVRDVEERVKALKDR